VYVSHLSLSDFRSYPSAELTLGPGVTSILGPNGQGKTNLVEAIGYVATLGSHRVAQDAPLVRAGAERAVLRATVVRDDRSTLVEIEITPGRANRARLNSSPVPRPREVLGSLRTVLFAPEDLALVKGDPDGRRRFVDDLLVLLAPRFAGVRSDYERVLKQRNALLKQAAPARARGRRRPPRDDVPAAGGATVDSTLDVWDAQLARLGAELLAARLFLLRRLSPHVAGAYRAVSDDAGDAVLGYRSSVSDQLGAAFAAGDDLPGRDALAGLIGDRLQDLRRQEVERGTSLVGPHRDDVVLELGGLPAKGYASHGESWSYALALRLASYELLREEGPGSTAEREPVLILDDVFAELDSGRRSRLAALVGGAEQVILTAAVEADVPAELKGERLFVRDGQVTGD
jgi:DNA replication and repair protein RecF